MNNFSLLVTFFFNELHYSEQPKLDNHVQVMYSIGFPLTRKCIFIPQSSMS